MLYKDIDSSYYIEKLIGKNINDVLELQKNIIDGLVDSTYLRKNTAETFERSIESGIIIGLFDKTDRLVGCVLYLPTDESVAYIVDRLPQEYQEAYDQGSLIQNKVSMVLPQFRGYRFQAVLGALLETIATAQGYTKVFVTYHPDNLASKVTNERLLGYTPLVQIEDYAGNLVRCVSGKSVQASAYETLRSRLIQDKKPLDLVRLCDRVVRQLG